MKKEEIDLFNRQLDNSYCKTMKDLCNLLISRKLKRIADDEQFQTMNLQLQSSGLVTSSAWSEI